MARDRQDKLTGDLLSWQPPEVTPAVDPQQVRAETLRGRVARAVALVLRECELGRDEIAARMSEFLHEPVSLQMLNAYASQAREEHTISAIRLAALAHATGDARALAVLVAGTEWAIVERLHLPAIQAQIMADGARRLERRARELREDARRAARRAGGAR
jgi:hypothetical protein